MTINKTLLESIKLVWQLASTNEKAKNIIRKVKIMVKKETCSDNSLQVTEDPQTAQGWAIMTISE